MRHKILVTGANGQLGSEFRDLADSYSEYHFIFTSRDELPVDDAEKIAQFFSDHQPDFCINCAAYTAVDKAELPEEEIGAFTINAEAVRTLAKNSLHSNTKFIHISTDYVFNGQNPEPYKENDPTDPINVYGASKLLGEKYATETNDECIIIRSSWIYSSHGKNFVKTMLRLMGDRKEVKVVDDQVGSPTYAADLAAAIMQIISTGPWTPGIYHYANYGAISWHELALSIRDLSQFDCNVIPIPSSEYPVPAKRPMHSVLDTTKIRTTYNVRVTDWKESLVACLKKIRG